MDNLPTMRMAASQPLISFQSEGPGARRPSTSSHHDHINSEMYLSADSLERAVSTQPKMRRMYSDVVTSSRARIYNDSSKEQPVQKAGTFNPERVKQIGSNHGWESRLQRLRSKEVGQVLEPSLPEIAESHCSDEELDGAEGVDARQGWWRWPCLHSPVCAFLGQYAPLPRDEPGSSGGQENLLRHRQWFKHQMAALQRLTLAVLQSIFFQCLTVSCILANAVVIGFETDEPDLPCWDTIELVFLVIFTAEVVMRLFVYGIKGYFCPDGCIHSVIGSGNEAGGAGSSPISARRKPPAANGNSDVVWNIFDFTIVFSGCANLLIVSFAGAEAQSSTSDASLFRIVRLLRLLRLLRLVRVVRFLKQLYLLAYGFLEGAMAVFWVAVLAASLIYVCAVVLVRSYHSKNPDDPGYEFFERHFYNIPGAMFTLFEIMASPTLSNYREVLAHSPLLAMFIVVFVIFGSFGMNGLLTGVISESIMDKNQARLECMRKEREAKRRLLESCCEDLFKDLAGQPDGTGSISRELFLEHKEDIASLVMAAGASVTTEDLEAMFTAMDYNDMGALECADFVRGILELCEDVRPMSIMEIHSQMLRCQLKIEQYNAHMEKLVTIHLAQQGMLEAQITEAHQSSHWHQQQADHLEVSPSSPSGSHGGDACHDSLAVHAQARPAAVPEWAPWSSTREASSSTAPLSYSLERGCADGGGEPSCVDGGFSPWNTATLSESAGAELGAAGSPVATATEGGDLARAGAAELARLAALQRQLAASASGGACEESARAAGDLAELGRHLARLVQDNAELVGDCLAARCGRQSSGCSPAGAEEQSAQQSRLSLKSLLPADKEVVAAGAKVPHTSRF